MTAIIGYLHEDGVFMAADRRRTGGNIKEFTPSPKITLLINKIYIGVTGSEMDSTKANLIKEVNEKKIQRIDEIVEVMQQHFNSDFALLKKKIEDSGYKQKNPTVQVILFGIDEKDNTFIVVFDSEDKFIPQESYKPQEVFGTGTVDLLIENRAKAYFQQLTNRTRKTIKLDEWTYEAMLHFSTRSEYEETIDFPIDYVLIKLKGVQQGLFHIHHKLLKPSFSEEFIFNI